jgi:hypothetical protein
MRRLTVISSLLAIAGCGSNYFAATPAPERPVVQVAVPFDKSWDAVIDVFAKRALPIATIDRSSGLIVASPLSVTQKNADLWASCGYISVSGTRYPFHASRGEFNVLVRPDPKGSTIRVTARWVYVPPRPSDPVYGCETKNVWEQQLETSIKAAAEGKTP